MFPLTPHHPPSSSRPLVHFLFTTFPPALVALPYISHALFLFVSFSHTFTHSLSLTLAYHSVAGLHLYHPPRLNQISPLQPTNYVSDDTLSFTCKPRTNITPTTTHTTNTPTHTMRSFAVVVSLCLALPVLAGRSLRYHVG